MFRENLLKKYLSALTEIKRRQVENKVFKIGDLVLISGKKMYRSGYCLARIIEIRPNRDDVVQVVKVKPSMENMCYQQETCVYSDIRRFITATSS